ncbi:MAG: NAD-dependent epimerase/dehydratase family protein [Gemmatimonadetes bacterium]|jgi:UDP-glucose 4-epimerase|nr:NAD-dependent epimerase/dehydratase family protein [Gemmatimonadota bacterium]
MITGKRVFITGGAGFIASHIVERLVDANQVTIFDSMQRNAIKYSKSLEHENLNLIEGDVLDAAAVTSAMEGADVVVHCAAIAGIYSVGRQPTMTMKVNLIGTYNVLEAAIGADVGLFLDFSTSEVYGPHVYKGEETDPTTQGPVGERRWTYAVSKLAAEHLAHSYHAEYDLPVITVRPFNVYGPRQVGEGAIREMIRLALADEPVILYGGGTQIRSWCYVDDFVDGILLCLGTESAKGQVFNLGNPLGTSANINLVETIIRLTNSKSEILHKPHPGPEVEIRVPSIGRAHDMLGFDPKVGLEEGIGRTIAWYRENLPQ